MVSIVAKLCFSRYARASLILTVLWQVAAIDMQESLAQVVNCRLLTSILAETHVKRTDSRQATNALTSNCGPT